MGKHEDLKGKKFGRLTPIEFVGSNKRKVAMWLCKCECGNEKVITSHALKHGTVSCGCYQDENKRRKMVEYWQKNKNRKTDLKINVYKTKNKRLANIHKGMKGRCYNANNPRYKDYGGRGIIICKEWLNDYNKFEEWALNNGYDEDLSIDRIDENGNYEPNNCRWADKMQQANNKRTNRKIVINGETKTLSEWIEVYNISRNTVETRMRLGWSIEDAITKPIQRKNI